MKKQIILLISLCLVSFISAIIFYIFLGERSFFFRLTLMVILAIVISAMIFFRQNIAQQLKRRKASRIKLIESVALILFSIAFMSLLKSFDLTMDWTTHRLFHLSKESKTIISQIEKPLTIKIFSYQEENIKGLIDYAVNLAKRYESTNPKKIKFESIDPVRDKAKADEYHIRQNGTIVFEMDDRREYITPNLLVENFQEGEIAYKGETIFSATIDKLNSNKDIVIYYLTGHGEIDFDSTGLGGYDGIKQMLLDRRYQFKGINLDHHPTFPEDADILLIADPKTQLSPQTYKLIQNYNKNGGNTLYLLSKNTSDDLNVILMESGFVYLPNVAVDPSRVAQNSGEFSIIPTLSPRSEITTLLRNRKQAVIFPSASVVYSLPEEVSDTNFVYDIRPLARMSQNGYGERSFKDGFYNKDDKDISGIYCLAISSTVAPKNELTKQRRSIVFGSVDFIDNARLYTGGNAEFFINSIDFLLRKDLKTTIAPKNENLASSVPTPEQTRTIIVIVLFWIIALITSATTVLIKRKNKVKNK